MRGLIIFIYLSTQQGLAFAAVAQEPLANNTLVATDFIKWGGSLLLVLTIFFMSVWLVRKAGGFASATGSQMRVLGGLSLGAKERVVLLQVGSKQLLLGVSPGRIETLHVLEGDDCLSLDETQPINVGDNVFSQKLMQMMKVQSNE